MKNPSDQDVNHIQHQTSVVVQLQTLLSAICLSFYYGQVPHLLSLSTCAFASPAAGSVVTYAKNEERHLRL